MTYEWASNPQKLQRAIGDEGVNASEEVVKARYNEIAGKLPEGEKVDMSLIFDPEVPKVPEPVEASVEVVEAPVEVIEPPVAVEAPVEVPVETPVEVPTVEAADPKVEGDSPVLPEPSVELPVSSDQSLSESPSVSADDVSL